MEPKTSLVDAILAIFSARLRVSTAGFKAEIASSRSFGHWPWVLAFMVENRGKLCGVKAGRNVPMP